MTHYSNLLDRDMAFPLDRLLIALKEGICALMWGLAAAQGSGRPCIRGSLLFV